MDKQEPIDLQDVPVPLSPLISQATGLIHIKLIEVMASVGAIGKDRRNKAQGFMFRGIDDVYNALNPALIAAGISVIPRVIDYQDCQIKSKAGGSGWRVVLTVQFRFYATDGSFVTATTIGEAADYADKASNKAMSVAYKYAIFQVFCIPTEDQVDSDSESPETSRRNLLVEFDELAGKMDPEDVAKRLDILGVSKFTDLGDDVQEMVIQKMRASQKPTDVEL